MSAGNEELERLLDGLEIDASNGDDENTAGQRAAIIALFDERAEFAAKVALQSCAHCGVEYAQMAVESHMRCPGCRMAEREAALKLSHESRTQESANYANLCGEICEAAGVETMDTAVGAVTKLRARLAEREAQVAALHAAATATVRLTEALFGLPVGNMNPNDIGIPGLSRALDGPAATVAREHDARVRAEVLAQVKRVLDQALIPGPMSPTAAYTLQTVRAELAKLAEGGTT